MNLSCWLAWLAIFTERCKRILIASPQSHSICSCPSLSINVWSHILVLITSPSIHLKASIELKAVQHRLTKCIVGRRSKINGDHLQRCDLLSLESRRIELFIHTVFKLTRGLHCIMLNMLVYHCAFSLRVEVVCVSSSVISLRRLFPIYLNTVHRCNGVTCH